MGINPAVNTFSCFAYFWWYEYYIGLVFIVCFVMMNKKSIVRKLTRQHFLTLPNMQSDDITRVARAAKIMERMVNQNTFDEIAQGEGWCVSMLPLSYLLRCV